MLQVQKNILETSRKHRNNLKNHKFYKHMKEVTLRKKKGCSLYINY